MFLYYEKKYQTHGVPKLRVYLLPQRVTLFWYKLVRGEKLWVLPFS